LTIFHAWSYGLACIAYALIAVKLFQLGFTHRSNERIKWVALAAITASSLWGFFGLLTVLSRHPTWPILSSLFDVIRYSLWCCLFLMMIRQKEVKRKNHFFFPLLLVTSFLIVLGLLPIALAIGDVRISKSLDSLLRLSAFSYPLISLVLLEQVFFNSTEDIRWRIKPLCLGLAAAFIFDLYLFSQAVLFNHLELDVLGVRGFVYSLIAPMLWLSLTRRRGSSLKITISPQAAFHSATLLIAGLYLIFISSVGYYVRYFGGKWGESLQLAIVFLSLLIFFTLILSNGLRSRLRVFVSKNFFHYRFDYREEWLKFTKTLAVKNTPQEMGQQVILGLAGMLDSPAGSLWTRKAEDAAFTQLANWNQLHTFKTEDANSDFCNFMKRTGWVINLDEYRASPCRYGVIQLPAWLLESPSLWLVIPLIVGDELIGFCVLEKARQKIDVNWEVNDLLKTAGVQAGGFLAQMQATDALLESRKFESFNRMSAFVVHDLKNIVTQLSLMMNNSRRLLANPEFQSDMLMTVENSLERMRQLMLQLREGPTPAGAAWGVNLSGVVERLSLAASKKGRHLEVHMSSPVVARCHEDRFERVLGHLIQNAFDATALEGRVWLNLDRHAGHARIVVGDAGHGMSSEFIRDSLFKPFQTTKPFGMGIGAYEIYQYVQELGGGIDVKSELGRGTIVQMLLPLFEPLHFSQQHDLASV
jgi:putative PEP-CTERM system histidine kinase